LQSEVEQAVFGDRQPSDREVAALLSPEAFPLWARDYATEHEDELPEYLRETYRWCYLDPRNCRLLDNEAVVSLILWGQHWRLQRAAYAEIEPGQKVLLPAAVYGGFASALARHIGERGKLVVSDINPVQLDLCRPKLAAFPWASIRRADARDPAGGPFDVICCYFLLHELPDDVKGAVVDGLLRNLASGGKVVFTDYHRPHPAHPLKPIMSQVFDRLEPFAKALWRSPISGFASDPGKFRWRTEALFGGLYQRTVAEA